MLEKKQSIGRKFRNLIFLFILCRRSCLLGNGNLVHWLNSYKKNGSSVFAEVKKQLRDRYYFREDASDIEIKAELKLADNIISSLQRLSPYMAEKRQGGVFVSKRQNNALKSVKLAGIVDYEGEQNLPLSLVDIKNKMHHLTDYQGKVVLLNFWASWCPPCVHEIPSMVRLKK